MFQIHTDVVPTKKLLLPSFALALGAWMMHNWITVLDMLFLLLFKWHRVTPLSKAWDEWGYFVPILMNFMITWLRSLGCPQSKVTVSWTIVMMILIMICVMESLLMPWRTYMYRSENKFMRLFLSFHIYIWSEDWTHRCTAIPLPSKQSFHHMMIFKNIKTFSF